TNCANNKCDYQGAGFETVKNCGNMPKDLAQIAKPSNPIYYDTIIWTFPVSGSLCSCLFFLFAILNQLLKFVILDIWKRRWMTAQGQLLFTFPICLQFIIFFDVHNFRIVTYSTVERSRCPFTLCLLSVHMPIRNSGTNVN
ncbi:hypothetical protein L9F63_023034, partial [Diploptera punctata]